MSGRQIIADHTVVDKYKNIPLKFITEIKKMWVNIPGESHSKAYRKGCQLLQEIDPRFRASIVESGAPEPATEDHLRISRATWGDRSNASGWIYGYGEEDFYTSLRAIERTKAHIVHCEKNNLHIAAFGFGWCWDMTWQNKPGGKLDPVYGIRWAGSSVSGPQGNKRWGLNAEDQSLTGNSVSMDTYLNATQEYMRFCQENNYTTRIFFTTGPVESFYGENGCQREIKHRYIRDFVSQSSERILLDYADILAWSDSGQENLNMWDGKTYQQIHPENMQDIKGPYTEDGDHIGSRGALRIGKAVWWMLARIAGWDGISTD